MSLEMMGMNEELCERMYRDTAISQVQGTLLLEAIGRQEGIKVEESGDRRAPGRDRGDGQCTAGSGDEILRRRGSPRRA